MAGESARASAQRQREKAERLQRSAELYERGAEGEQATAEALSVLPRESWTVFHDQRWPGRRFANVDHVVVGPPGVFVIDSKNWSGAITIRDDVLHQNGRSRETAVAGAAEVGLAVGSLVSMLRPELVRPVLCFVRDEPLTGWARDVMICSTTNVAAMLLSRPAVLDTDELRQLTLDVDAGLRAATDAAVPVRPSKPAAAVVPSPKRSHRTSRRRRSTRAGGIKALAAVAFLGVLYTQPAARDWVSEGIAGWFTDGLSETEKLPAPKDEEPVPKEKGRDREQRQR